MPQFGASLTGDARDIIYDHNMFVIKATHKNFVTFILRKNYKIAYNSTTTKAMVKLNTYLEYYIF